jgi:predicted O-methyltransferase YrrM
LGSVIQHLGEAVDIIPTLDMKFDFFIDADKENYINYFISFFQNEQRRDYPF